MRNIIKIGIFISLTLSIILILPSVEAAIPTKKITPLYTLLKAGKAPLSKPSDVAVNNDYVYVVDGDNNRIVIYKKQGKYIRQFGKLGQGQGEFN